MRYVYKFLMCGLCGRCGRDSNKEDRKKLNSVQDSSSFGQAPEKESPDPFNGAVPPQQRKALWNWSRWSFQDRGHKTFFLFHPVSLRKVFSDTFVGRSLKKFSSRRESTEPKPQPSQSNSASNSDERESLSTSSQAHQDEKSMHVWSPVVVG